MSAEFLRNLKITGKGARRVAEAVAACRWKRAVCAPAAELRRALRRAERVLAADAGGALMAPVYSPIGVAVPVGHLFDGDGVVVTERFGRFLFFRPRKSAPLLLPRWSVDNFQLTRAGVRAVDRTRLPDVHRRVGAIRDDLVGALRGRADDVQRILCQIPRDATGADVLELFPAEAAAVAKVLSI